MNKKCIFAKACSYERTKCIKKCKYYLSKEVLNAEIRDSKDSRKTCVLA
jgi:hypothetical protein